MFVGTVTLAALLVLAYNFGNAQTGSELMVTALTVALVSLVAKLATLYDNGIVIRVVVYCVPVFAVGALLRFF